jgi:replication-associated recombination protein RarA
LARLIDSIHGHENLWLKLASMAEGQHLPHAMVFTGTPGVGKRMVAWALAQFLVCEALESRPCGVCPSCRRVEARQSESILALEPEGQSLKLEAAHQVLRFLSLQRVGRARVVIVDQAQHLTPQAGNALLKVVEEPPPESYFVFIAPEASQLLPTLRSRTQVLRFAPLTDDILTRDEALPAWMVRASRGSFENLESLRDTDTADLRKIVADFLVSAFRGDRSFLREILEAGKSKESGLKIMRLLQQFLRDWTVGDAARPLHEDLRAVLISLPDWEPRRKSELWRYSFQMEADYLAHVDRGLIFENFFYRVGPTSQVN